MNKLFLKLAMLPSGLWKSMGADVEQLKAILKVRLTLDDRKPLSFGRQQRVKKDRKYGSLLNIFLSFIMGILYTLPLAIPDRIFSLAFYFTLFLFMLTFMLITDFSNVLFDARDKYTLLPRPVNDRTLVLSRLLYVFIYLLRIVFPMSIAGWVILGIMDGWKSVVLFPLPLVLMVFMALFFVNGIYLLLLRLAKPGRFKEIINYFQIIFSILFFACAYLLPRLFDARRLVNFNIHDFASMRWLPSYWLAACWSWLGFPAGLPGTVWLSSLAVLFPLICLFITVRWLSPQFADKIGEMDSIEPSEQKIAVKTTSRSGKKFYKKLADIFNRSDAAKAGFIITWLQTSRSRSFKMRVYPTFAYVPVYFFYLLTTKREPLNNVWHGLKENPSYLLLLYLCSFVLMQALTYLTMSDQYKAAWIYYASPLVTPGKVMSGGFKAIWVKYFIPFFAVLGIFIVSVWGISAIIDVVLALINVTLFSACIMRIGFRHLPFSIIEQTKQGGVRIIKVFISMIVVGGLGFGHYMAIHMFWLKLVFLLLSGGLLWLVWDSYANTSWESMIKSELE